MACAGAAAADTRRRIRGRDPAPGRQRAEENGIAVAGQDLEPHNTARHAAPESCKIRVPEPRRAAQRLDAGDAGAVGLLFREPGEQLWELAGVRAVQMSFSFLF